MSGRLCRDGLRPRRGLLRQGELLLRLLGQGRLLLVPGRPVLCLREGGSGLRRMEMGLPFTCQAEAPGLTDQGAVVVS